MIGSREGSNVLVGGFKPEDIEHGFLEKKLRDEQQARRDEARRRETQPPDSQSNHPSGDFTVLIEKRTAKYQGFPGCSYAYYVVRPVRFGTMDYEVHIKLPPLGREPDLLRTITDPRRSPTFWGEEAKKALNSNVHEGFYPASAPFYANLFLTLTFMERELRLLPKDDAESRLGPLADLRTNLNSILEENEIATLTNGVIKTNLTPSGQPNHSKPIGDLIIHNYGTPAQRESDLACPGGLTNHTNPFTLTINTAGPEAFSQGLFGMRVQDLARALYFITRDNQTGLSVLTDVARPPTGTSIPLTMWKDPRGGTITFYLKEVHPDTAAIGVRIYDPTGKAVLL